MKTVLRSHRSPQLNRTQISRAFMLKALPSALMLVFAQPGWTQATINTGALAGLPVNGSVTAGSATETLNNGN